MARLTKEAEDALIAVAFRGDTHVVARPRAVRAALLQANLLYPSSTRGTHITDTATPAGKMVAAYARDLRDAQARTLEELDMRFGWQERALRAESGLRQEQESSAAQVLAIKKTLNRRSGELEGGTIVRGRLTHMKWRGGDTVLPTLILDDNCFWLHSMDHDHRLSFSVFAEGICYLVPEDERSKLIAFAKTEPPP
jgi:hypothetical protein